MTVLGRRNWRWELHLGARRLEGGRERGCRDGRGRKDGGDADVRLLHLLSPSSSPPHRNPISEGNHSISLALSLLRFTLFTSCLGLVDWLVECTFPWLTGWGWLFLLLIL